MLEKILGSIYNAAYLSMLGRNSGEDDDMLLAISISTANQRAEILPEADNRIR
jgi:hypothetical protein